VWLSNLESRRNRLDFRLGLNTRSSSTSQRLARSGYFFALIRSRNLWGEDGTMSSAQRGERIAALSIQLAELEGRKSELEFAVDRSARYVPTATDIKGAS
jgi:hypothetical protein